MSDQSWQPFDFVFPAVIRLYSPPLVKGPSMERFTISLDESLAHEFDQLIRTRGYTSRSEAVRDLIRKEIETDRLSHHEASHCVGTLSYVYNHHERRLAERLTTTQHHAHDMVVSSMHIHLDHDQCLETLFLKGETTAVRRFAEQISAECGVRHGVLNLIPVDMVESSHNHVHAKPRT